MNTLWWQYGVGLLFYKLLCLVAWIFGILVVLPFVINFFNGKGYVHNFKTVWNAFVWVLRMGMARRNKV